MGTLIPQTVVTHKASNLTKRSDLVSLLCPMTHAIHRNRATCRTNNAIPRNPFACNEVTLKQLAAACPRLFQWTSLFLPGPRSDGNRGPAHDLALTTPLTCYADCPCAYNTVSKHTSGTPMHAATIHYHSSIEVHLQDVYRSAERLDA